MADGFLGRWSRRKLDAKEGRPLEVEAPASVTAPPAVTAKGEPTADGKASAVMTPAAGAAPTLPAGVQAAPPEPPPTMADVQALTPASDFSRFTGSQVAPEVNNAAMKKLFADPHFNVMDGLDIYIDDYGQPDPMPASMLRNLASAEFLGLFREDKKASPPKENPEAAPRTAVAAMSGDPLPQSPAEIVAQSGPPEPVNDPAAAPAPDADPDLRLQQDPAPGPQGPREGTQ